MHVPRRLGDVSLCIHYNVLYDGHPYSRGLAFNPTPKCSLLLHSRPDSNAIIPEHIYLISSIADEDEGSEKAENAESTNTTSATRFDACEHACALVLSIIPPAFGTCTARSSNPNPPQTGCGYSAWPVCWFTKHTNTHTQTHAHSRTHPHPLAR